MAIRDGYLFVGLFVVYVRGERMCMCVYVCVRERGGGRMDRQTDRQTEGVCLSHVFILGIGLSFCPLANSHFVAGPL